MFQIGEVRVKAKNFDNFSTTLKVICIGAFRQTTYDFPLVFHRKSVSTPSCAISEVCVRLCRKSQIFYTPRAFGDPLEYRCKNGCNNHFKPL